MSNITIEQIKALRDRTGVGFNSVKEALEHSGGDDDKAITYLREKGLAKSAKRASKEALNGTLGVYVHGENRMVVVVEVATETDFAAKGQDLRKFANDLALHIAAVGTKYVGVENIPAEVIVTETEAAKVEVEGKPAEIADKIVAGKLEKFYVENVLTHQKLFQDDSKTVQDYLNEMVAKIGEKVEITRFVRIQIASPAVSCGL